MKPVQRCTTAVLIAALAVAVGGPAAALADGPGDNVPGAVRPIPPPGIELDEATSSRLLAGAAAPWERLHDLPHHPG